MQLFSWLGRNARRDRSADSLRSPLSGVEVLEGRLLLSGQAVITGKLWNDIDFDGAKDSDEPVLAGRTVYLDFNNDGRLNAGEVTTISDADGDYAFTDLAAGTYAVRQALPPGWLQSSPEVAASDSRLVLLEGYRDLVTDSARGLLYATTDRGAVERIDLRSGTRLTPFIVGTNLFGADITPDGRYLYVAEGHQSVTGGVIYKVDLNDGSVSSISYTRERLEGGAYDIAIGSNGRGLLTTQFNGSGWVPLRRLDTNTDVLSALTGAHSRVRQSTQIERSADGTLFFLTESNSSSGPIFTYDPVTNSFGASAEAKTFLSGVNSAVSSDGTLIATEVGGVSIMDAGFKAVESLGDISGGFAFDPTKSIFYALDVSDASNDAVVAYDTTTWQELFRFRVGENVSRGGNIGSDTMRVTEDGRFLVLGTPSGVRIFDLVAISGARVVTVEDTSIATGMDFGSFADFTPEVNIGDAFIVEGNTGNRQVLLTVSLSAASYRSVDVTYVTTDGSATTAGLDYFVGRGSVTFAAGETARTIAITIRGDVKDELDERLFVDLLSADGAIIGDGQGEVVISNDDVGVRSKLSGLLWNDRNVDGIQDAGEVPLSSWTVYLDENNNGLHDAWERSETTGADGRYTFVDLPVGDYTVAQIVPVGWRQTTDVGLAGVAGQAFLLPAGTTSNPLYQYRDLVFDPARNHLIVTTAGGTVERIDLSSMRLLDSWQVGGSLLGADITSDGNTLYVADGRRNVTQGFVRKVDLTDGTATFIAYDLAFGEGGGFDVAIGSDGTALVTTQYLGSGWTPLRYFDTATDRFSFVSGLAGVRPNEVRQNTALYASFDRKRVLLLEPNSSSGPVHIYDATTNSFPINITTGISLTNVSAATNRDGSFYAFGRNGLTVYDATFQVVATRSFGDGTRGLVFDSQRDLLYRAGETEITVLETKNWNELFRIPIGETLGFGKFPMSVSEDGRFLFLGTNAGVRVYNLVVNAQRVTLAGVTIDNADFGNRSLAENQPPTPGDDIIESGEGSFSSIDLLANDSDPERDPLSIVAVNGEPTAVGSTIELASGATIVVSTDGLLSLNDNGAYDDLAVGESAVIQFTYDVSDGLGGVATATVTINVHGENDSPVANPDLATVGEYGTVTGNLLANDTDIDGDSLMVAAFGWFDQNMEFQDADVGQTVRLPSGARLTVNADGTFVYDPAGAFVRLRRGETAEDTFSYAIRDGQGEYSNPAHSETTVTITILGGGGEDDLVGYTGGKWYVSVSNSTMFDTRLWATWADVSWDALRHGDFNGDGGSDVLGLLNGKWYVGISTGSMFKTSLWTRWVDTEWKEVSIGDLNGDGFDDILARTRGQWWAALSTGSGFEAPSLWTIRLAVDMQRIFVEDANADGNADLITISHEGWWLVSISDGESFSTARYAWAKFADIKWDAIGTFDGNGDDRTDIFGLFNGAWYTGLSYGSGFSTTLRALWRPGDWKDAVTGDFDGDGRDDIAARWGGTWWVGLSSASGGAASTTPWAAWKNVDWQDVTVGDFDGDGRDDIAGRFNGQWWVARSTGVGFTTSRWGEWKDAAWRADAAVEVSSPRVTIPLATVKTAHTMSEQEALAMLWSSTDDDEFAAALLAV